MTMTVSRSCLGVEGRSRRLQLLYTTTLSLVGAVHGAEKRLRKIDDGKRRCVLVLIRQELLILLGVPVVGVDL